MAEIIINNLVFCANCTIAAVNGDFSGIEDEQQYADTTTGLERLGKIGAVYHAGQEPDEFSTRPCDCCGSRLAGSREYFIIPYPCPAERRHVAPGAWREDHRNEQENWTN